MLPFHLNSQAVILSLPHHKILDSTLLYSTLLSFLFYGIVFASILLDFIPFQILQNHFHLLFLPHSNGMLEMAKRNNYISQWKKAHTSVYCFIATSVTTIFNRYISGLPSIITTIYITISIVVTIISNFTILSLVAIIRWFYFFSLFLFFFHFHCDNCRMTSGTDKTLNEVISLIKTCFIRFSLRKKKRRTVQSYYFAVLLNSIIISIRRLFFRYFLRTSSQNEYKLLVKRRPKNTISI